MLNKPSACSPPHPPSLSLLLLFSFSSLSFASFYLMRLLNLTQILWCELRGITWCKWPTWEFLFCLPLSTPCFVLLLPCCCCCFVAASACRLEIWLQFGVCNFYVFMFCTTICDCRLFCISFYISASFNYTLRRIVAAFAIWIITDGEQF